jgi:hypothetical protein
VTFASPIPWWAAALAGIAIIGIAYWSYCRPVAPLSAMQRGALTALRALSLGAVLFFLCRPVVLLPPSASGDVVVPILVDVSRSMRIADAAGRSRLEQAIDVVQREIVPALQGSFTPEIYAVGQSWAVAAPEGMRPEDRHSNLVEAVAAVRERHRGRRVPGIVLVSDGGHTGSAATAADGPPVITVGVGTIEGPRDREVIALSAGEPRVDQTSIDLHVSAVSRGYGRSPVQLRILANGSVIDSRTLAPSADGSPIDEFVTVSPDPSVATVYTAEITAAEDEAIVENNSRSVLVSPVGRKRRLLALVGAPGYEFSFLARALVRDPGLELDSIVRKGQNESGQHTYLVQASGGRAAALTSGFPASRETLFSYDGLIVANVEGDFFTRAQLEMAAEFVSLRGGGLVVLGGRSFAQRGLIGTPLEQALPVELNDRRGAAMRDPLDGEGTASTNVVSLTAEGESHPAVRIGATPAETRKLWTALPPLAASAALGGPRPGATVLAVTSAPSGARYPLIAVQRYGRGRAMVFAGEAAWRWRMLVRAADRTYEHVWRQAARWLVTAAPDPVSVIVPAAAEAGDSIQVEVEARERNFAPAGDATLTATVTAPGGVSQPLTFRRSSDGKSTFTAPLKPEQPGLYRVQGEARRGTRSLGAVDAWFYVGGADREFADPRLNEAFLRRLARASGGQYVGARDASRVGSLLQSSAPQTAAPEQRDIWHEPWTFALVVALLSAEWILRRRWGLR